MKLLLLTLVLCSILLLDSALGQNAYLDQPLSQGFSGLDNQSLSGETKTYTINLLENASWLFLGVLAREGSVNLEVKNSSNYVFPGSGSSVVIENAQKGTYTVTVSGNGKYVVFWDYVSDYYLTTQTPYYDPTIPTLRFMSGVNFGIFQASIAAGEVKKYYINLPDQFPAIDTPTVRRDALPLGQNYREFEVNILDRNNIAAFTATIANPRGEVYPISNAAGGLYFIKFQNAIPGYPGRYLLTVEAQFPPPYTASGVSISWGSKPSPLPEELRD